MDSGHLCNICSVVNNICIELDARHATTATTKPRLWKKIQSITINNNIIIINNIIIKKINISINININISISISIKNNINIIKNIIIKKINISINISISIKNNINIMSIFASVILLAVITILPAV